jgi:osmotically-inducible protein OsmY
VDRPDQKQRAEALAKKTKGVKKVVNQLKIKPKPTG